MDDIQKKTNVLRSAYDTAIERLNISQLEQELQSISEKIAETGFWDDNLAAQEIMKKQSALQSRVEPWKQLGSQLTELSEMASLGDESLQADLQTSLEQATSKFDALKAELRFNGKYDDHDAVITLSAGAGGTDAQDWTALLLRMYTRWAEQQNMSITLIEESAGEEAGLKRATLEINGPFAYGKLASEHGVHRLVRLSPFNSDSLRQTSFAKVDVMPKIDRPDELEIDPKDLKIDVYRAGGHGGQSVNTTDSAVRITHIPSGVTVSIQNERSQLQNKETAMTVIRSRLAVLQIEQHKDHLDEIKGPNQSAEWGNQIRSYVLHPYKQVKDLRTRYETSDAEGVLDGNIEPFISAYLEMNFS
ncbi:MAG: peptide chain release factor 2 [Candidatus Saccharibacteria bacterium]